MINPTLRGLLNPWKLAVTLSAVTSVYVTADFSSGGRFFRAIMPADSLWVAVKDVLVLEEYESRTDFAFQSLPRSATVVDAGAFVGLYSLKASPFVEKVVPLEPSRKNYSLLTQNVLLNGITNIEPRQVALTSGLGFRKFRDAGPMSFLVNDFQPSAISYEVPTTGLNELVEEIGRIDLMKMDIEGSEYETILNSDMTTLKKVDKLVGEIHVLSPFQRAQLGSVVGRLRESGMDVSILYSPVRSFGFGLVKPWRCSLERIGNNRGFLYRLLISAAYGLPLMSRLRAAYDVGTTAMLFARRK